MSIRLLEYKLEDSKDMYLVEYPGKGQRWVYSFMVGGQYKEEKAALKYRYEQRAGAGAVDPKSDQSGHMDIDGVSASSTSVPAGKTSSDARESLKCICQQQHATAGEEIITCSLCLKKSHVRCVRSEGFSPSEIKEWQCPFCRILHMDPFNPGVELLMFTTTPRNMLAPSSQEGNLTMRFNIQPNVLKEWQARKMSIVVRCIGLGPKSLQVPKGPLWPREATASVNSYKDVFKILPGKYGHVRREVPSKEVTDLIKPNSNSVMVAYRTETPPANAQMQPARFMFGVIACEGRSKTDILSLIKRLPLEESREKDIGLVMAAQRNFLSLQSQDLVIETRGDFEAVHTRCPLSLCEIATPVRGVDCEHLQCYDADSFVDVNMKTRNVEKRWICPVCSKITRPEDLIVDEFLLAGMQKVKDEIDVDADQDLLKRLKLDVESKAWIVMEDEALEGEGSDDEDDGDMSENSTKKRRKEDGGKDASAGSGEEIVLD